MLQQLEDSGEGQLSRHDPDARHLRKEGHALVGYNMQCVMDGARKPIVTQEVTNAGDDLGQRMPMIEQTISELGLPVAGMRGAFVTVVLLVAILAFKDLLGAALATVQDPWPARPYTLARALWAALASAVTLAPPAWGSAAPGAPSRWAS